MSVRIESVFWRLTPFYRERGAAFDRRPGRIGNDSDSTRQFDNRSHTANSPSFIFLKALQFRARERRPLERRVRHSRDLDINPITRFATDNVGSIDPRGAVTYDFEIARVLQRRILRQLDFGCFRD